MIGVSEAFARAVEAEIGTTPVFALIGDANLHIVGALDRYTGVPLRFARDEGAALAMADGYAQATGSIGVASVTSGPGLTHAATSLLAAARMRTPLVVLAGDTPLQRPTGLQEMQNFDQRRFAEACEALVQDLASPASLAEDIRNAFHRARTLRRPVVVNLPLDLQSLTLSGDWRYRPSHEAASPAPLPPNPADIERLIELVSGSRRPLFVAGRGAVAAGALDEIERLAGQVGALLGTTLLAKGAFGDHPWSIGVVGGYSTPAGRDLIRSADLVVAFGADFGHFTTQAGTLFKGRTVVGVDIRGAAGVDFDMVLQADARETAVALVEALDDTAGDHGFRSDATRESLAAPWPAEEAVAGAHLDPRQLMKRLGGVLPEGARVVVGGGHFWSFPCLYLDPPRGGDFLCPLGAAAIGQALPFAIGVATADPGRPVVVIEGDGSFLMNLQELDTAARHRLPLLLVVMNDEALTAERIKLGSEGYRAELAMYPSPDFASIARGFGWAADTIAGGDDIAALLRDHDWRGGPRLVDARIDRSVLIDPVAVKDLSCLGA